MDTYSFLRELADSWVLLAMTVFYVGAIVWALWPSRQAEINDAASIPLRNETPRVPDPAIEEGAK